MPSSESHGEGYYYCFYCYYYSVSDVRQTKHPSLFPLPPPPPLQNCVSFAPVLGLVRSSVLPPTLPYYARPTSVLVGPFDLLSREVGTMWILTRRSSTLKFRKTGGCRSESSETCFSLSRLCPCNESRLVTYRFVSTTFASSHLSSSF